MKIGDRVRPTNGIGMSDRGVIVNLLLECDLVFVKWDKGTQRNETHILEEDGSCSINVRNITLVEKQHKFDFTKFEQGTDIEDDSGNVYAYVDSVKLYDGSREYVAKSDNGFVIFSEDSIDFHYKPREIYVIYSDRDAFTTDTLYDAEAHCKTNGYKFKKVVLD